MAEGPVAELSLAPLAPFDPVSDPTSLEQRWKAWKRHFETYVAAINITDGARKSTQSIFDTLSETGDSYGTAIAKQDDPQEEC